MASFRNYGTTITIFPNPTATTPYSVQRPTGGALARVQPSDRSYDVGDTITFSGHGSNVFDDYVLHGFQVFPDGTRYPILDRVGGDGFVILFGDESPTQLTTYSPTATTSLIVTSGGYRFGEPTVFADYGLEDPANPGTFDSQDSEIEILTDDNTARTYNVGDQVDLQVVTYTGSPAYIDTVKSFTAELVGFYNGPGQAGRASAGAPILQPEAGFNGGRRVILSDDKRTSYEVPTAQLETASWTTCFAPGTLIATPHGERAVEELGPGDMVSTAAGGAAPVKFVGMQKVQTMFGSREFTRPVRIKAGALGDGAPHSDLVVTKDHGMIVDGVLCHAGALVNGTGIVEVPGAELEKVATYYHVETEGHVQLLANGAAAESFLDNADRALFANHADFVAMHGTDVPPMAEMDMPRAMSARQVPQATRARLAARGEALVAPAAPAPRGFLRRLLGGLRGMARPAGRRAA